MVLKINLDKIVKEQMAEKQIQESQGFTNKKIYKFMMYTTKFYSYLYRRIEQRNDFHFQRDVQFNFFYTLDRKTRFSGFGWKLSGNRLVFRWMSLTKQQAL